MIAEGYLNTLESALNIVYDLDNIELFENIALNVGNMMHISTSVRLEVFGTQIVDLLLMKYKIFEFKERPAGYMIWFLSNALNDKFDMLDDQQFLLFSKSINILVRHKTEENLLEAIWALMYLMRKTTHKVERLQTVLKTNFVGILTHELTLALNSETLPKWTEYGIESLRLFFIMAGSSYCSTQFLEVVVG